MTRADQLTLALYRAQQAVLLHLRDQGHKVQLIPMAERQRLAEWLQESRN
jgi:hypothetical protein